MGSYGDITRYLLASTGYSNVKDDAYITESGRVTFKYKKLSGDMNYKRYIDSWSKEELENMLRSSPFLISTHILDQVKYIKNTLKDKIKTVGITYTSDQYEKILRNWIIKVGVNEAFLIDCFGEQDRLTIEKFKEKNLYHEYLFRKFTQYPNNYIPQQVDNIFDINLPFEVLESGDLDSITKILDIVLEKPAIDFFNSWFSLQE